ncbi:MAG: TIGR04084 family radical SAM/SPASM domain-containing protein [Candidatus Nezhaarchaeota archaeon]|nr:TIGR04084 family radical SAM/SPASM domain-containing protein [Candidatus Nezhaarchaeota archaeon]MCX8142090.1 TIGR04084 family radical SAM/SPASM domain-containing protein [Candidatus Nezhaarchaeota archaeon]MDW8050129.1 TIGR04084 family radical SAM/SPASM domain-containing protein [Nitrososphaerota archaeon]
MRGDEGELRVLCYVLTTGRCNLKCSYCGGSFPEHLVPANVKYRIEDLKDFLSGAKDLTIAFYGGEPLLNPQVISSIMDRIEAKHFVIQTNGLLIERLPRDYWLQMDAVLLSIDGVEHITDLSRGRGVYKMVIEAAKKLRAMNYEGDLIARMTVTELSDIHRDVMHILSLEVFDHVHWQLNAVWNPNKSSFSSWLKESYIPKMSTLIETWTVKALRGKLMGIAPFKALLYAMIKEQSLGMPPCGAGWHALAVNTNGDVLACPIAVDAKWAKLGNVRSSTCQELLEKVKIEEPCISCHYVNLCGGRCLYSYYERLWGDDGFKLLCLTTQSLIDKLHEIKPRIKKAVKKSIIKLEELRYPPFLNTIEIIP